MAPETKREIDCTPNQVDGLRSLKENRSPEEMARERSMLNAAQKNFGMFSLLGTDRKEKVAMAEKKFQCKQQSE